MKVNQSSDASVNFDINRPLRLSRSSGVSRGEVHIYSKAVDGSNSLRVATVSIANVVALTEDQEHALANRIADEIVAPAFSEDEIMDIAFEIMDIDDYHDTICDHHINRARHVADSITARRRLNLSGAR
jgi:hypothetical protein